MQTFFCTFVHTLFFLWLFISFKCNFSITCKRYACIQKLFGTDGGISSKKLIILLPPKGSRRKKHSQRTFQNISSIFIFFPSKTYIFLGDESFPPLTDLSAKNVSFFGRLWILIMNMSDIYYYLLYGFMKGVSKPQWSD